MVFLTWVLSLLTIASWEYLLDHKYTYEQPEIGSNEAQYNAIHLNGVTHDLYRGLFFNGANFAYFQKPDMSVTGQGFVVGQSHRWEFWLLTETFGGDDTMIFAMDDEDHSNDIVYARIEDSQYLEIRWAIGGDEENNLHTSSGTGTQTCNQDTQEGTSWEVPKNEWVQIEICITKDDMEMRMNRSTSLKCRDRQYPGWRGDIIPLNIDFGGSESINSSIPKFKGFMYYIALENTTEFQKPDQVNYLSLPFKISFDNGLIWLYNCPSVSTVDPSSDRCTCSGIESIQQNSKFEQCIQCSNTMWQVWDASGNWTQCDTFRGMYWEGGSCFCRQDITYSAAEYYCEGTFFEANFAHESTLHDGTLIYNDTYLDRTGPRNPQYIQQRGLYFDGQYSHLIVMDYEFPQNLRSENLMTYAFQIQIICMTFGKEQYQGLLVLSSDSECLDLGIQNNPQRKLKIKFPTSDANAIHFDQLDAHTWYVVTLQVSSLDSSIKLFLQGVELSTATSYPDTFPNTLITSLSRYWIGSRFSSTGYYNTLSGFISEYVHSYGKPGPQLSRDTDNVLLTVDSIKLLDNWDIGYYIDGDACQSCDANCSEGWNSSSSCSQCSVDYCLLCETSEANATCNQCIDNAQLDPHLNGCRCFPNFDEATVGLASCIPDEGMLFRMLINESTPHNDVYESGAGDANILDQIRGHLIELSPSRPVIFKNRGVYFNPDSFLIIKNPDLNSSLTVPQNMSIEIFLSPVLYETNIADNAIVMYEGENLRFQLDVHRRLSELDYKLGIYIGDVKVWDPDENYSDLILLWLYIKIEINYESVKTKVADKQVAIESLNGTDLTGVDRIYLGHDQSFNYDVGYYSGFIYFFQIADLSVISTLAPLQWTKDSIFTEISQLGIKVIAGNSNWFDNSDGTTYETQQCNSHCVPYNCQSYTQCGQCHEKKCTKCVDSSDSASCTACIAFAGVTVDGKWECLSGLSTKGILMAGTYQQTQNICAHTFVDVEFNNDINPPIPFSDTTLIQTTDYTLVRSSPECPYVFSNRGLFLDGNCHITASDFWPTTTEEYIPYYVIGLYTFIEMLGDDHKPYNLISHSTSSDETMNISLSYPRQITIEVVDANGEVIDDDGFSRGANFELDNNKDLQNTWASIVVIVNNADHAVQLKVDDVIQESTLDYRISVDIFTQSSVTYGSSMQGFIYKILIASDENHSLTILNSPPQLKSNQYLNAAGQATECPLYCSPGCQSEYSCAQCSDPACSVCTDIDSCHTCTDGISKDSLNGCTVCDNSDLTFNDANNHCEGMIYELKILDDFSHVEPTVTDDRGNAFQIGDPDNQETTRPVFYIKRGLFFQENRGQYIRLDPAQNILSYLSWYSSLWMRLACTSSNCSQITTPASLVRFIKSTEEQILLDFLINQDQNVQYSVGAQPVFTADGLSLTDQWISVRLQCNGMERTWYLYVDDSEKVRAVTDIPDIEDTFYICYGHWAQNLAFNGFISYIGYFAGIKPLGEDQITSVPSSLDDFVTSYTFNDIPQRYICDIDSYIDTNGDCVQCLAGSQNWSNDGSFNQCKLDDCRTCINSEIEECETCWEAFDPVSTDGQCVWDQTTAGRIYDQTTGICEQSMIHVKFDHDFPHGAVDPISIDYQATITLVNGYKYYRNRGVYFEANDFATVEPFERIPKESFSYHFIYYVPDFLPADLTPKILTLKGCTGKNENAFRMKIHNYDISLGIITDAYTGNPIQQENGLAYTQEWIKLSYTYNFHTHDHHLYRNEIEQQKANVEIYNYNTCSEVKIAEAYFYGFIAEIHILNYPNQSQNLTYNVQTSTGLELHPCPTDSYYVAETGQCQTCPYWSTCSAADNCSQCASAYCMECDKSSSTGVCTAWDSSVELSLDPITNDCICTEGDRGKNSETNLPGCEIDRYINFTNQELHASTIFKGTNLWAHRGDITNLKPELFKDRGIYFDGVSTMTLTDLSDNEIMLTSSFSLELVFNTQQDTTNQQDIFVIYHQGGSILFTLWQTIDMICIQYMNTSSQTAYIIQDVSNGYKWTYMKISVSAQQGKARIKYNDGAIATISESYESPDATQSSPLEAVLTGQPQGDTEIGGVSYKGFIYRVSMKNVSDSNFIQATMTDNGLTYQDDSLPIVLSNCLWNQYIDSQGGWGSCIPVTESCSAQYNRAQCQEKCGSWAFPEGPCIACVDHGNFVDPPTCTCDTADNMQEIPQYNMWGWIIPIIFVFDNDTSHTTTIISSNSPHNMSIYRSGTNPPTPFKSRGLYFDGNGELTLLDQNQGIYNAYIQLQTDFMIQFWLFVESLDANGTADLSVTRDHILYDGWVGDESTFRIWIQQDNTIKFRYLEVDQTIQKELEFTEHPLEMNKWESFYASYSSYEKTVRFQKNEMTDIVMGDIDQYKNIDNETTIHVGNTWEKVGSGFVGFIAHFEIQNYPKIGEFNIDWQQDSWWLLFSAYPVSRVIQCAHTYYANGDNCVKCDDTCSDEGCTAETQCNQWYYPNCNDCVDSKDNSDCIDCLDGFIGTDWNQCSNGGEISNNCVITVTVMYRVTLDEDTQHDIQEYNSFTVDGTQIYPEGTIIPMLGRGCWLNGGKLLIKKVDNPDIYLLGDFQTSVLFYLQEETTEQISIMILRLFTGETSDTSEILRLRVQSDALKLQVLLQEDLTNAPDGTQHEYATSLTLRRKMWTFVQLQYSYQDKTFQLQSNDQSQSSVSIDYQIMSLEEEEINRMTYGSYDASTSELNYYGFIYLMELIFGKQAFIDYLGKDESDLFCTLKPEDKIFYNCLPNQYDSQGACYDCPATCTDTGCIDSSSCGQCQNSACSTCQTSLVDSDCVTCRSLRQSPPSCDWKSEYIWDSSINECLYNDESLDPTYKHKDFLFDNNSIGSPLQAGNGIDLVGAPESVKDRGIYFDGNESYLLLEYGNFIIHNWFSYQMWIRPDSVDGDHPIFELTQNAAILKSILVRVQDSQGQLILLLQQNQESELMTWTQQATFSIAWSHLVINSRWNESSITCILNNTSEAAMESAHTGAIDIQQNSENVVVKLGQSDSFGSYKGFIVQFSHYDREYDPVYAGENLGPGSQPLRAWNIEQGLDCKTCGVFCNTSCKRIKQCSQCTAQRCLECDEMAAKNAWTKCKPYNDLVNNITFACECQNGRKQNDTFNNCEGSTIWSFIFWDVMVSQNNIIESEGSTGYQFQLGANADIFADDDPFQILERGLYFAGSQLGIIRLVNPVTRTQAWENISTTTFWVKVEIPGQLISMHDSDTSKLQYFVTQDEHLCVMFENIVISNGCLESNGTREKIQIGQWIFLGVVIRPQQLQIYMYQKKEEEFNTQLDAYTVETETTIVGAQYTPNSVQAEYSEFYTGFIYQITLVDYDVTDDYFNVIFADPCTYNLCEGCDTCILSDDPWNEYNGQQCAAHCTRGCKTSEFGRCSFCDVDQELCQYWKDLNSGWDTYYANTIDGCVNTPDKEEWVMLVLELTFSDLAQSLIQDGIEVARRGEHIDQAEDADPILLPDARGMYFLPISYIVVKQPVQLSPTASITTWFRLQEVSIIGSYTFVSRTKIEYGADDTLLVYYQQGDKSIHVTLNNTPVLKNSHTFDTDAWHFLQIGISEFWVQNTKIRAIFDTDLLAEIFLTDFTYADEIENLTTVGADITVQEDDSLSLGKGFSGFMSQFSFWFGLLTVPFTQQSLAQSSCSGCSVCPSSGQCLPMMQLTQQELSKPCNWADNVPCDVAGTCYTCHEICAQCDGATADDCISCATGYVWQGNGCTCGVNRSFDASNVLCVWDPGFYEGSDKEWQQCHSTWAECTGSSFRDWTACRSNEQLVSGECIAINCDANEYVDIVTRTCKSCYSRWETCQNGSSECLTCKTSYFLYNNEWVLCPEVQGYDLTRSQLLSDITITVEQRNCVEMCGDGLNLGLYSCDDGNTFNGDGCSSDWETEEGFACTGGSSTTSDVCTETVSPTYSLNTITSNSSNLDTDKIEVELKFSEKVIVPDFWVLLVLVDPSRDFTYDVSEMQQAIKIGITLFPNEATSGGDIVKSIFTNCQIFDEAGNELESYAASTQLIDYQYYQEEALESAKRIQSVSTEVSNAAGGSAGSAFAVTTATSSFTSASMTSLWHFVDIAQIIHVYRYLNVDYPPNLNAFFDILGFSQAEFLPNSFEFIIDEDHLENQEAPQRYDELDINANFFLNAGSMIQIWLLVIFTYPLAKGLSAIFPGSSTVSKWKSDYKYSALFRAGIGSFIEISISCFLQAQNPSLDNYIVAISTVCAIMCFFWIIAFPFYILRVVSKANIETLNSEEFKAKFGTLYTEFKLESAWTRNFVAVLIVRRMILSLCLVYLHDYTMIQLPCTIVINIVVVLWLVLFRPYASRRGNIIEIITECLVLVGQSIIAYQYYADIPSEDATNIGFAVIGMFSTVLLIHMLGMLIAFAVLLYKLVKVCYWKIIGRKMDTVAPIVPEKPTRVQRNNTTGYNETIIQETDSNKSREYHDF